jgi:hypothetical protein
MTLNDSEQFSPVLKALSARVRLAAIYIRRGENHQALAVLEQCERVLPLPTKNNWRAAKDAARRAGNV